MFDDVFYDEFQAFILKLRELIQSNHMQDLATLPKMKNVF